MSDFYILDGTIPVPIPDVLTWGAWFETAERHVAETTLEDGTRISTVFLGIDHQWGQGPPLLFETMVFSPAGHGGDCRRYATWQQAEQGHEAMLAGLQAAPASPPDDIAGTVIWPRQPP